MTDNRKSAVNGWILLDKPRGLGSTQAVGAVKRNLREAGYPKTKVGHGGTLDPLAEGVLPIALGEATKLAGRMLDASKVYAFTIRFGEETDTLDTEGEVTTRTDRRPPVAAIDTILDHFTGAIEQLPPAYSAIKVDGKRAYDRARAGEQVEMAKRKVTIHRLDRAVNADWLDSLLNAQALLTVQSEPAPAQPYSTEPDAGEVEAQLVSPSHDDPELAPPPSKSDPAQLPIRSAFQTSSGRPDPYDPAAPLELLDEVTRIAHVSKGTYIRSLARDIAHALGTCGHVTYLRRIKAGPFVESQAISLDKLNQIGKGAPLQDHLLPLDAGLDDIPALSINSESAQAVRQGRIISDLPHADGLYLAKSGDIPIALVELTGGTAKIVRGFNIADVAEVNE